jgi:putative transposase
MDLYSNQTFHIYNQGNNRRQVFFSDENYQFFIWRMRAYLLPFGDLIAYCLMPNHFHWLFYIRTLTIERQQHRNHVDHIEFERRKAKYGKNAQVVQRGYTRYANKEDGITLNESIGLLLQSYAKSINKEKGWSGSLFKKECKAKDGWIDEFVTVHSPTGIQDTRFLPGTDYKYHCMCYIHDNPVEGDLVKQPQDWLYSSARDYAGLSENSICNLSLGRELLDSWS